MLTPKLKDNAVYPVHYLFNNLKIPGDVGIEIELEGNKFPKDNPELFNNGWQYHQDHSLRGNDNAEYVLTQPILFAEVKDKVSFLFKKLDKYGTICDDSNRTSVHVHLNAQGFYLNRLTAFCALYFTVEEILTEWCGDHRVGNLFCLRAKDAPNIISKFKEFLRSGGRTEFRDNLHYAALNLNALQKFGSIEVRTMRGASDPNLITKWVAILERIYNLSANFEDPREIPSLLSENGSEGFLEWILGDNVDILKDLVWSWDQIRDSLYEGVRMAQDICYAVDWTDFKPETLVVDPFGRIKKKNSAPSVQESYSQMLSNPPTITVFSPQTLYTSSNPFADLSTSSQVTTTEEADTVDDWYDPEEDF